MAPSSAPVLFDSAPPAVEGGALVLRRPPRDMTFAARPSLRVEEIGLEVEAVIQDPQGRRLATDWISLTRRTRVNGWAHMQGQDRSGAVALSVRVAADGRVRLGLELDAVAATSAEELLSSLRFARHLVAPNSLTLLLEGRPMADPEPLPPQAPAVDDETIDVIRALAFVQRETGSYFAVPEELGARDRHAIVEAEALLRGREVEGRWRAAQLRVADIPTEDRPEWLQALGGNFLFEFTSEVVRVIAGHEVNLGTGTTVVRAVHVTNPDALDAGGDATLDLEPAVGIDTYTTKLLSPAAPRYADELAPPVRLSGEFLSAVAGDS